MAARLDRQGRVRLIIDDLRTSLWFLPSLMMAAAALLSALTLRVDRSLPQSFVNDPPWWLYVSSREEARAVLSTLLTAMITMTSLVFSITMVVLTLAARQFGPRLVRNFMGSSRTQIVLGAFMMTIIYVLLVLPTIGARDDPPTTAYLIVSVAMILTLVSIVLLVPFIHSLAQSIVSETVIEQVGGELDALIKKLPPIKEASQGDPRLWLPKEFSQRARSVGPPRAGYVQAVQFEKLVALANERDLVLGLYFSPGDYVVEGSTGIAIYPSHRADRDVVARVQRAISIGGRRTPAQDPEFAMPPRGDRSPQPFAEHQRSLYGDCGDQPAVIVARPPDVPFSPWRRVLRSGRDGARRISAAVSCKPSEGCAGSDPPKRGGQARGRD